jgi:hypothetical protein
MMENVINFGTNMLDADIFTSKLHEFLEEAEQLGIHKGSYNYIAYLLL